MLRSMEIGGFDPERQIPSVGTRDRMDIKIPWQRP